MHWFFGRGKLSSTRQALHGLQHIKCYYLTFERTGLLTSDVRQWFSIMPMHTYHPGVLTCFANAIFPTPSPENLNHLACGRSGTEASLERPPKWVQSASRKWTPAVRRLSWPSTKMNCPSWKSYLSTLSFLGSPYHLYSNCLFVWQTDQYIALGVVWRNGIMHAYFPQ